AGLEQAGVLDADDGLLAADQQPERDGERLALAGDGDERDVGIVVEGLIQEAGLGVWEPDEMGDTALLQGVNHDAGGERGCRRRHWAASLLSALAGLPI